MSARSRDFLLTVLRDDMNLKIDDESLPDEVLLGSSGLELESLAFTELAVHAERRLGISIPDSEMGRITGFNVGEFTSYLDEQLRAKGENL